MEEKTRYNRIRRRHSPTTAKTRLKTRKESDFIFAGEVIEETLKEFNLTRQRPTPQKTVIEERRSLTACPNRSIENPM